MYHESIIKLWCPHCDKVNYINNGNPEDLTVPDLEGFQCWFCDKKFLFTEDELEETNDKDVFLEKGKEVCH